jgi:Domain of unknown function (DUF4167)
MRSAQKNNRSRGRGNRKGGGGGNVVNRVYDSAGPEGKVRGTPQQIIDKYLSLARDAQTTGDRVVAENFLQHAEHYQRLLIQAAAMQEQSRRESADAATDFDSDENETTPMPSERRAQPQPQPQPEAQPRPEAAEASATEEIGGMTMIDSGNGSEDLLVVSEEITQSQPRRNGDGRRRRAKQPAGEARETEQQLSPEPQPQSES